MFGKFVISTTFSRVLLYRDKRTSCTQIGLNKLIIFAIQAQLVITLFYCVQIMSTYYINKFVYNTLYKKTTLFTTVQKFRLHMNNVIFTVVLLICLEKLEIFV